MPFCRDPFVANLQAQGFNALRVPRTDYVPGTILFHVRKSPPERFGELSDAFEQAPTVEAIASSQAYHFTGVSTGRYRRQMGLKLAAQWLGVPQTAVEAALGGFTRVSFHFAEMRLLSTDIASIAALLPGGEPTEALLALPDSRLFVVHEVLQAKQISCLNEIENQNAASVAVSVEAAATARDTMEAMGLTMATLDNNYRTPYRLQPDLQRDTRMLDLTGRSRLNEGYDNIRREALKLQHVLFETYGPFYPAPQDSGGP